MAEPNIGELITYTQRHRRGEVADNVSNTNALLSALKQRGRSVVISGGRTYSMPLAYAEADFQRYSGFATLSVQAVQDHDSAEYDPMQAAVPIAISGRDMRMNRGEEQAVNLITAKIENAERTMANNISNDIYSDGTADHQINGLEAIVSATPATGTVGGINAATFDFWRNNFVDVSTEIGTFSAANQVAGMRKLWIECVRGSDKPDLITSSDDFFTNYESQLQDNQRYTRRDRAGLGFDELMYKSAPVVYDGDGDHPAGMYFLNTNYLMFVRWRGGDFEVTDENMSYNQDAMVRHILFMGNLVCSNRSLQGFLQE